MGERGRAKQQKDQDDPHHHRRPTPFFQRLRFLRDRGTIFRTMFTELGADLSPAAKLSPPQPSCMGGKPLPVALSDRSAPALGRVQREAADGASQKEPAIGDGSQSGRKRSQAKAIRGSVCRNSHMEREILGESTAIRGFPTQKSGRRGVERAAVVVFYRLSRLT